MALLVQHKAQAVVSLGGARIEPQRHVVAGGGFLVLFLFLEGVARRLVASCGLEWEPACLAFHENRRPVRTASVTQVRQPIYKKSVARWRNYENALALLFAKL
jgi:hypothetical protein